MERIIFALVILFILGLLIWSMINQFKHSQKDWEILYDLEKRANEINSLEELITFHDDFKEKAKRIHNEFITPRLSSIDGYCRGLYKSFTKDDNNVKRT